MILSADPELGAEPACTAGRDGPVSFCQVAPGALLATVALCLATGRAVHSAPDGDECATKKNRKGHDLKYGFHLVSTGMGKVDRFQRLGINRVPPRRASSIECLQRKENARQRTQKHDTLHPSPPLGIPLHRFDMGTGRTERSRGAETFCSDGPTAKAVRNLRIALKRGGCGIGFGANRKETVPLLDQDFGRAIFARTRMEHRDG